MSSEPRISAVVAVIMRNERFLIVKRSRFNPTAVGYWSPVSGEIEPGESQEDTVAREVREEVGLDAVADEKLCEIPSPDGLYLLHYWTTMVRSGEARICSREVDEVRWVTLAEMRQLTPHFEEDIEILGEVGLNRRMIQ